ncbi:tetratricopeptide repeat protein [Sorangium sp. So ce145]|uniref:tetratricopeptide repeat protein n=1 Tax=Sorangium sp. So ce145 TaxID=3133285 RepID=UPI003F5D7918
MRCRSTGVCLLLSALCASPAAAQDGPALAQSKAAAVALAEQGWAHYEAQRYAEALLAFRQAEAKAHASPFLLMVARCYVKLGRFLEARDVYRLVVDEKLAPGAPSAFAEAKGSAMKELAELEARTPTVEITVTGTVAAGLELTLDGLPIQLATPVQRDPGDHTLVVRTPGRRSLTKTVHLTEGARERIALDQAAIDALPIVERPEDKRAPAPTAKGRPDASPSPAARTPHSNFQTPIELRTPLLVAGGVVAGAGIVTGMVFAVLTGNRADHAEEVRNELKAQWGDEKRCPEGDVPRCSDLKDAVYDEIDLGNVAFWSLVAGGTVGVGTLVYGLVTMNAEPQKTVPGTHVAPFLGPGTAGLSFSGRF